MTADSHSVLVITKDSKISQMMNLFLASPLFETEILSDFNEARRKVLEKNYNIIITDYADGEGCDFAMDFSDSLSTILLLVPNELYEQISYKVETSGILTVSCPFDQFYFYGMLKAAIAVKYKVQLLQSQTTKLKVKMEEIRIINKAKMLLMQYKKFSEQEAHRYLEKEAMDHSLKRITVAENVIKELEP